MKLRDMAWAAPALAAFVFLSSFLGLAGHFFWLAPADAFAMMQGVWEQSVGADAVFVVGSVLAAILGFLVTRRTNVGFGALASVLGNWLTYGASFLLLPYSVNDFQTDSWLGAFPFVGAWGIFGLIFCALSAPAAAHFYGRWSADASDEAALA